MIDLRCCLCIASLMAVAVTAQAREWSDTTGQYKIEADLIGFDDKQVILQREDKELGAFPMDKLSEADRAFLKSKVAQEAHADNLGAMQTWTGKDGLKVVGRIVDYTRAEVTLQRRRGKTYVNNTVLDNMPPVYQQMLPKIVSYLESASVPDKAALDQWVRNLRGLPKTYNLEGVVLELENGDEYGVPFFLFSEKDQDLLKSGWNAWLKDNGEEAVEGQQPQDHSFRLQSMAAAYQQDKQIDRQIAVMNLNMQAIQAGLTSAWEVTLYPGPGNPYPPRWVISLGRNSLEATDAALRQNPGFVSGPVRRVSNRPLR